MPGIWDFSCSIQGPWIGSDGMVVVNGILKLIVWDGELTE